MRTPKILFSSVFAILALAGTASAQITIANVFNAASRVVNGSLAQGALIAVEGRGVGTNEAQQASFPLPTTSGLGGVTIQIVSGGQFFDGIMVYTKPNEVGAILPSAVPVGPATLTVNNNGATASKNINVIDAAFGIFTQRYGIAAGLALAFNANDDGSVSPNSTTQSVTPGRDVIVIGTGLGAVASDETQSGVTDIPSANIQVFVGIQPAIVVSAGRGTCCDGIDPAYPIPQGIAAWDVIRFTVPDGITGCYIPVVVQIGKTVSNFATISIDPGGAACTPVPTGLPLDLSNKLSNQTGASTGAVGIGRATTMSINNRGVLVTNKADSGGASFVRYPELPASVLVLHDDRSAGVERDRLERIDSDGVAVHVHGAGPVRAGPAVHGADIRRIDALQRGPSGSRNIVKRVVGQLFDYPGVTFGDTSAGNFFDPGRYTISDAAGGKDVGSFTASIDVQAARFIWTNIPDITKPVDRRQDFIIKWTGGIPNTQVVVAGSGLSNGVATAFECAASVEAGQLTVPAYVLLQVPPTGSSQIKGGLSVLNSTAVPLTANGLDLTRLTWTESYHVQLEYQ